MRVGVWWQATEGKKEDSHWVFGILLKKTLEIDYSIFLTLWKQKLVHRHSMCSELDHLPPSALPCPSSASSCSPLSHCISFVPGQAPCWQQSVPPYERAAQFDFSQSLSPPFPSCSLAEPLAVPVQHSKPSKAPDESFLYGLPGSWWSTILLRFAFEANGLQGHGWQTTKVGTTEEELSHLLISAVFMKLNINFYLSFVRQV